ncbi:hypothetical protein BKA62DRAFT_700787 [Auriculariales sp. MPI-PUGE-AT-0066]|nr:hypothetical protein BKA62DRAFT_700787 [Auriculariales sp. MPI-PUGE-AT-0066]
MPSLALLSCISALVALSRGSALPDLRAESALRVRADPTTDEDGHAWTLNVHTAKGDAEALPRNDAIVQRLCPGQAAAQTGHSGSVQYISNEEPLNVSVQTTNVTVALDSDKDFTLFVGVPDPKLEMNPGIQTTVVWHLPSTPDTEKSSLMSYSYNSADSLLPAKCDIAITRQRLYYGMFYPEQAPEEGVVIKSITLQPQAISDFFVWNVTVAAATGGGASSTAGASQTQTGSAGSPSASTPSGNAASLRLPSRLISSALPFLLMPTYLL